MKRIIAAGSIIPMLALCSCAERGERIEMNGYSSTSYGAEGMTALSLDAGNANVAVVSDGTGVALNVTYTARGYDEEKIDDILSRVVVNTSQEGGLFTVSFIDRDSGKDIWEWINKNARRCSLDAEVILNTPEDTGSFEINVGAGDVSMSGVSGIFNVSIGSGNLTANIDSLNGGEFSCGAGGLNLSLKSPLPSGNKLDVSTGSGDISLKLSGEKESASEIELSVGAGDVSLDTNGLSFMEEGNSSAKTVTIDSGCTVNMAVGSGQLTVTG